MKTKRKKRVPLHALTYREWIEHNDQYAPEDWLLLVLDGTYSIAEMRAAIREDRAPKRRFTGRKG